MIKREDMTTNTKRLVDAAKLHRITTTEKEAQRRSFAYGNTKIENPRITHDVVSRQAEHLKITSPKKH